MGLKAKINEVWKKSLSPIFDEFAIDLQVAVIDKNANAIDEVYDEAKEEKVYASPVTVKGRIKLGEDRLVLAGGQDIKVDGKITFKTDELNQKRLELTMGTKVGFGNKDYEVMHIEKRTQVGEQYLLTKIYIQEM